jgi:xanthine/uracil permease
MQRVVEQRVTSLSQGLLILITMRPPLLHVLGLIPQSVLAGLFFVMGVWSEAYRTDSSDKDFRGMGFL